MFLSEDNQDSALMRFRKYMKFTLPSISNAHAKLVCYASDCNQILKEYFCPMFRDECYVALILNLFAEFSHWRFLLMKNGIENTWSLHCNRHYWHIRLLHNNSVNWLVWYVIIIKKRRIIFLSWTQPGIRCGPGNSWILLCNLYST